jgi:hypothetical protein
VIVTENVEASPLPSPGERVMLRVYPNPVHSEVSVVGQNIVSVTISNLLGQVLDTPEPTVKTGGELSIDISALPVGVYVLEVVYDDGGKVVRKIVKE